MPKTVLRYQKKHSDQPKFNQNNYFQNLLVMSISDSLSCAILYKR